MQLKIISNILENIDHHGTVDRDQPDLYYDYRGKAKGCDEAARTLPSKISVVTENKGKEIELSLNSNTTIDYEDIKVGERELSKPYLDALYKVHSKDHVEGLKSTSLQVKLGECNQEFGNEASVWSGTYRAAISSVKASLRCVDLIVEDPNNQTRAFANVWPAGHHAEGSSPDSSNDIAMGFCYLSNASIAAIYARDLGFRTLVIDIDNHSGNGTRKSLMNKDGLAVIDLVYCSPFDEKSSRYLDGFYDSKKEKVIGIAREFPYRHDDPILGTKQHPVYSASNILSLEFRGKEYREKEYREEITRVEPAASPNEILDRYNKEAMPWIEKFNPEIIIWSIGVDSAFDDPLGALGFAPSTFYEIIKKTSDHFPTAKVMGVMEGGYKAENWKNCLWPALYGLVS